MTRRRSSPFPGRLSLLDLPPSPPVVVVAPVIAPPEPVAPALVSPPASDGFDLAALPLPPGILRDPCYRNWFCVCHPDGSERDALAVLSCSFSRRDYPIAYKYVPALGRGFEMRTDWETDLFTPSMEAMRTLCCDTLGLPAEELHFYCTTAGQNETRPILRDVPHRGNVQHHGGGLARYLNEEAA